MRCDMQRFQKGSTVYANSTWNKAEKCTVNGYVKNESSTGKNVYMLSSMNGTFGATEDCVFETKDEAYQALIDESTKVVNGYKSEIKTLKDLLMFPLSHCISCGEEYTDWDAQKAYKERIMEITGIKLDE